MTEGIPQETIRKTGTQFNDIITDSVIIRLNGCFAKARAVVTYYIRAIIEN